MSGSALTDILGIFTYAADTQAVQSSAAQLQAEVPPAERVGKIPADATSPKQVCFLSLFWWTWGLSTLNSSVYTFRFSQFTHDSP